MSQISISSIAEGVGERSLLRGALESRALRLGVFLIANGVQQVGALLSMALVGRWLGPTDTGLWILAATIVRYMAFAPLGVTAAQVVVIPVALGQGDTERARRVGDVAFWWAVSVGSLVAVGAGVFVYAGSVTPKQLAIAIGAVIGLLMQLQLHWRTLSRAFGHFYVASLVHLLNGVCLLGLVAPAAQWGGLGWAFVALAVSSGGPSLVANGCLPRARLPRDLRLVIELLRVGLPIMLVNITFIFLLTLDRLVIAKFMDEETLGFYMPAVVVGTAVTAVPQVVTTYMYTRMGQRFGKTGDARMLFQDGLKLAGMMQLWSAAVGGGLLLVGPGLISRYLPGYESGIGPARMMALASVAAAWQFAFQPVLVFLKRVWLYLGVLLASLAVGAVLAVAAVRGGHGLTGVATAMLACYVLLSVLVTVAAVWACRAQTSNQG